MTNDAAALGTAFAKALAAKDFATLVGLLADDVDFRALTPRKQWESTSAPAVVRDVVSVWFGDGDHIEELIDSSVEPVANGRSRLSYRLHVRNADGLHLVEQQVYFDHVDDRITWMRVLCTGYLPV